MLKLIDVVNSEDYGFIQSELARKTSHLTGDPNGPIDENTKIDDALELLSKIEKENKKAIDERWLWIDKILERVYVVLQDKEKDTIRSIGGIIEEAKSKDKVSVCTLQESKVRTRFIFKEKEIIELDRVLDIDRGMHEEAYTVYECLHNQVIDKDDFNRRVRDINLRLANCDDYVAYKRKENKSE